MISEFGDGVMGLEFRVLGLQLHVPQCEGYVRREMPHSKACPLVVLISKSCLFKPRILLALHLLAHRREMENIVPIPLLPTNPSKLRESGGVNPHNYASAISSKGFVFFPLHQ